MLDDRLHLLVVEAIAVHRPDPLGKVEDPLGGERRTFDKLAVFPVAAGGGHFADIDLRVEVGGKGLAVTAGVGVDDVDLFDHIQILLGGQGGVDIGHARIEAGAEQRHDPGLP